MANLDSTYLGVTVRERLDSKIRRQFQQDAGFLYNWFRRLPSQKANPNGVKFPIGLSPSASHSWYLEGADLAVPDTEEDGRFSVGYARYNAGFEMTGDFLTLLKFPDSLIKTVDEHLMRKKRNIQIEIAQQLYQDGSAKKCVIANNTVTGSIATAGVTAGTGTAGAAAATGTNGWIIAGVMPDESWTYGVQMVPKRARCNVTSPTGTVRQGTGAGTDGNRSLLIVTAVTGGATQKVFFDQVPTDVAVGDYLVWEGSYGNSLTGLERGISNDTTVFQGINRATYPQANSRVIDAANAPLTYGLMLLIGHMAVYQVDEETLDPSKGLVITSEVQMAYVESFIHGQRRYGPNDETLKVGMPGGLMVNGNRWKVDRWCQEDVVYYLHDDALFRIDLWDLDLLEVEGKTLFLTTSTTGGLRKDRVSGWFKYGGNMAYVNPRALAKIKRLDVTRTAQLRGYLAA